MLYGSSQYCRAPCFGLCLHTGRSNHSVRTPYDTLNPPQHPKPSRVILIIGGDSLTLGNSILHSSTNLVSTMTLSELKQILLAPTFASSYDSNRRRRGHTLEWSSLQSATDQTMMDQLANELSPPYHPLVGSKLCEGFFHAIVHDCIQHYQCGQIMILVKEYWHLGWRRKTRVG